MESTTDTLARVLGSGNHAMPARGHIGLVAMIRDGLHKDSFELALDNTGRWVAIPRTLVQSVEQVGILELRGESYPVAALQIRRPEGDAPWFDLLQFVMDRAVGAVKAMGGGCDCAGANTSTGAPAGARAAAMPMMRASTLSCFACFVFTLGTGPDFCYHAGMCR